MQLFTQESLRKLGKRKQLVWDKLDIGLPPVLHELEENRPVHSLSITNIIDFDDREYHISQNVGRKIAQMAGEKDFAPYLQGLLDYRKMEIGGVSSERLTQEGLAVNRIFVNCFNKVASRQRIVLLFDTIEKLSGTDVFKYLLGLGTQLENVVLVIGGRPEASWELLESQLGDNIQVIDLLHLDNEASTAYLRAKQELLHITLEPALVQKLLLLAQGRPILIDLAMEWRARERPLDWLISIRLEELLALSEDERKERQKEFEKQLVHHIVETRSDMDWLVLLLARVYPLDAEMITKLRNMPEDKAEALFTEAKTFVFIKSLPDGRITLHDEMRRMVDDYAWLEVDPSEDRRRLDSRRASDYLRTKTQVMYDQIACLEKEGRIAHKRGETAIELSAFLKREALERVLWVLEGQRLGHTLYVNFDEGIEAFAQIFDRATQYYSFSFRETLVTEVQRFADKLSETQKYEVNTRRAQYLTDEGIYDQARLVLNELLENLPVSPKQRGHLLMQSGDVEVQAGNFEEGVEFYEQAAKMCQASQWEKELVQAEKAVGYSYRLIGDWENALTHYMQSYRTALKLGDQEQQGWLLNNLAFVYTLRQQPPDVALKLSDQAIQLWTELGSKRGLGAAYSTRGSILYEFGRYEEALPYFDRALEIFESQEDLTWLSTVYNWQGITKWALGQHDNDWQLFEQARQDLEKAREFGLPRDQATILNRLSRVYYSLKQNDKARQLSEQSYEFALKTNDRHYEIVALDTLALIDVTEGKFSALSDFQEKVHQYLDKCPKENQRDNVTLGRLFCRLGHLALGQKKTEEATDYYKEGLSLVSTYSSYGWFSLPPLLESLESTWKNELSPLPEGFISGLGNILIQHWLDLELDVKSPEALSVFTRWQQYPS